MSVTFTFDGCNEDFEINMANANARLFLENFNVNFNDELYGEWGVEELTEIWCTIDLILMSKNFLPFTRETVEDGNITYCGITKDYVQQRLYDFRNLIMRAIQNNQNIRYA